MPGKRRKAIGEILAISNRRICFYCYHDGHDDDFPFADPNECKFCEGKWIKEKRPRESRPSQMQLFREEQDKRMTSLEEKMTALMNIVSTSNREMRDR